MNPEIVESHGRSHSFPKSIPKKREKREVLLKVIVGISSIIAGVLASDSNNKLHFLLQTVSGCYTILFINELILRCCTLLEEVHHLQSRYNGSIFQLLRDIFYFNNINKVIIPSSCILASVFPLNYPYYVPIILIFTGVNICTKLIKLEESSLYKIFLMNELNGLDYGSGMAHSYFYGYLRLMLPYEGDERKGIKEQIEDYESKHNVEFSTKKLYIFIPLSAHCPPTIDENSRRMQKASNLNSVIKNRGGVTKRQYHNAVYKLWPDVNHLKKKPIYVCCEYATPLLTFYEVINQNTENSRLYKLFQKEIVTNFYMTLDNIIKGSLDCHNLCELIYYRDVDDYGQPLQNLDIADLLMERIKPYLKKDQYE